MTGCHSDLERGKRGRRVSSARALRYTPMLATPRYTSARYCSAWMLFAHEAGAFAGSSSPAIYDHSTLLGQAALRSALRKLGGVRQLTFAGSKRPLIASLELVSLPCMECHLK